MQAVTKHTPGPWVVQRIDIDCGIIQWAVELPDMRVIARTGADVSVAQDKANARLIAAAPDMYEALINLENDDGTIPKNLWLDVKSAILKAQGKTTTNGE